MKYKQKPKTPSVLDDTGADFWDTYCRVFLDRSDLHSQYLPSIELLCFLEQQRVEVQETINENGLFNEYDSGVVQPNGSDKLLQKFTKDIRALKSDLRLNPTEESSKPKKSSLLDSKPSF